MLVLTKTYKDYNNKLRKENFYFNLTQAEVTEMETTIEGGLSELLKTIVDAADTPAIIKAFKEIVLKAYGIKSDDGRRLIKSPEISEAFSQTEAYSIIFMELVTDEKKAANFINKIMPKMSDKNIPQISENNNVVPLPNNESSELSNTVDENN